jgi:hypothetical protein
MLDVRPSRLANVAVCSVPLLPDIVVLEQENPTNADKHIIYNKQSEHQSMSISDVPVDVRLVLEPLLDWFLAMPLSAGCGQVGTIGNELEM